MTTQFAALSYRVKADAADHIRRIFSPRAFQRAGSAAVLDENGNEVGYMAATALFLQGTLMVRVSQYAGDFDDLARHIARLPGARRAEEALAGCLAEPGRRCGGTPAEFLANFKRNTMRPIAACTYHDRVASISALHRRLRPDAEAQVSALFQAYEAEPVEDVYATAFFVRDGDLVEVVQHDSATAADAVLLGPERVVLEQALAELAEPPVLMPSVSQLSVADRVGAGRGE